MIKKLSIIIVCILFLFIVGCTHSNAANSKEFTPSDTDIVSRLFDDIKNESRLKEFIQNTEAGQKDSIRVVTYTKEGAPILTNITFDGDNLEVSSDSTRDDYGSKEMKKFKCKEILAEGKKYSMISCDGYEVPYHLAEDNK
ncbi:DUF4362 domain-containing protein [Alkalihalobacillus sp. TS-13]|uniref:DUF4362 domain-containing protein n=1 Tax=Alkalihalobacillus sp. TS-13 TaxID=2842455 RepID=UPI001C86A85E|nr:DUF4362 domain-containing protein [Alkalihalobacillus sp. TS-13]